jgi:guanylate kinase
MLCSQTADPVAFEAILDQARAQVSLSGITPAEIRAWEESLVCIAGPSAVGKHTLCHEIMHRCPAVFTLLGPATTRECTTADLTTDHYASVTPLQFDQLLGDGVFLYWHKTPYAFYGIEKQPIRDAVASGARTLVVFKSLGAIALKLIMPRLLVLELRCSPEQSARRMLKKPRHLFHDEIAARLSAVSRELDANQAMCMRCSHDGAGRWHQLANDVHEPPIASAVVQRALGILG